MSDPQDPKEPEARDARPEDPWAEATAHAPSSPARGALLASGRLARHLDRLPKPIRVCAQLIHAAVGRFILDRGPLVAAALAFYGLLSLGPTVVLVTEVAGWFLGEHAAQATLEEQLSVAVGSASASAVARVATELETGRDRSWGFVGVLVLLYAATRVFANVQTALNQIWNVRPRTDRAFRYRVAHLVKNRVRSLCIVGLMGLVLLASVVASAVLEAVTTHLPGVLPAPLTWRAGRVIISVALSTAVFTVLYRSIPDARIEWRDVWPGALVGGLLFAVGKVALGWYIGSHGWSTVNETATALLVVLIWASYSANVFLFGAEFAEVWSERYGTGVTPYGYAMRTSAPASIPEAPEGDRSPG